MECSFAAEIIVGKIVIFSGGVFYIYAYEKFIIRLFLIFLKLLRIPLKLTSHSGG